jgi:hypothetical protein
MDADERHAFGAHYTNPVDIAKVIQPTIVRPWRAALEEARDTSIQALEALLDSLHEFTVLDPACGAGNFLYIAYRELRRIEAEIHEAIASRRRGGRRDYLGMLFKSSHSKTSMGILHSSLHRVWFEERCSTMRVDLRYTASTVFDTFPWPQSPSSGDIVAVEEAVGALLEYREGLLRTGTSYGEQYNGREDPGCNPLRTSHGPGWFSNAVLWIR